MFYVVCVYPFYHSNRNVERETERISRANMCEGGGRGCDAGSYYEIVLWGAIQTFAFETRGHRKLIKKNILLLFPWKTLT